MRNKLTYRRMRRQAAKNVAHDENIPFRDVWQTVRMENLYSFGNPPRYPKYVPYVNPRKTYNERVVTQ